MDPGSARLFVDAETKDVDGDRLLRVSAVLLVVLDSDGGGIGVRVQVGECHDVVTGCRLADVERCVHQGQTCIREWVTIIQRRNGDRLDAEILERQREGHPTRSGKRGGGGRLFQHYSRSCIFHRDRRVVGVLDDVALVVLGGDRGGVRVDARVGQRDRVVATHRGARRQGRALQIQAGLRERVGVCQSVNLK